MMVKHEMSKLWLRVKSIHPHLKEKLGPDNTRLLLKGLKWAAFVAGSLILIAILFVLLVVYPTLPDVRDLKGIAAAQSSTIFDREGNPLYVIHGEENRKNVELKNISPSAISASLAIEDDGFYKHGGVDFGAILMAVCHEVRLCPTARGGSTITQQFIKNAYLSSERTYSRKLKEILLALKLESSYTKDEILGMYLNRIPYGSSIYGIERAAETFFGKSSKDLTLAEGAILASIPKAPSYYSPYGANRYATINLSGDDILKSGIKTEQELVDVNPDFISKGLLGKTYTFGEGESQRSIYVKGRVDFVLGRMRELGYINDEQVKSALVEANSKEFKPFREEIVAPHFVMYVRQFLEEKYGKDTVEKGGLKITTTIDPKLQAAAEKAVADHEKLNLDKYKASNASLVSMDPDTGQILAMVGSKDYWNEEIDGKVNIALRSRLPGSSFKPIVYAAAFLQGYAPSTVLYDVEMAFSGWYKPENYDGENRGPVTIRQALAWSLN
ncbi:penicillin-binding protein, partial [Candidatus Peregrinibacteria bacterium]|nr:penicillin-binding protein [Candidatus Peregrinibacteria bacterium]